MVFSDRELAVIRALQEDLPLRSRPYRIIAEKTGMQEDEVLAIIRKLQAKGVVRRIGAVLAHRALGITANALVLWAVPEEKVSEMGRKLAALPEITHCYHRQVPATWPYNLFTMVHARNRQACLDKIERIARNTGLSNYRVLISTRELKKSGITYRIQEG